MELYLIGIDMFLKILKKLIIFCFHLVISFLLISLLMHFNDIHKIKYIFYLQSSEILTDILAQIIFYNFFKKLIYSIIISITMVFASLIFKNFSKVILTVLILSLVTSGSFFLLDKFIDYPRIKDVNFEKFVSLNRNDNIKFDEHNIYLFDKNESAKTTIDFSRKEVMINSKSITDNFSMIGNLKEIDKYIYDLVKGFKNYLFFPDRLIKYNRKIFLYSDYIIYYLELFLIIMLILFLAYIFSGNKPNIKFMNLVIILIFGFFIYLVKTDLKKLLVDLIIEYNYPIVVQNFIFSLNLLLISIISIIISIFVHKIKKKNKEMTF